MLRGKCLSLGLLAVTLAVVIGQRSWAEKLRQHRSEREFRSAEQAHWANHLELVLARGYLGKLLGNSQVFRYLSNHHQEVLAEFQKIAEIDAQERAV